MFEKPNSHVLEQLVDWIALKLGLHQDKEQPQVEVQVEIPADLAKENMVIKSVPKVPIKILLWDMMGNGKIRMPIETSMLKDWQNDFYLELRVRGFKTELFKVIWGQALNKVLELKPKTVSIGIEQFNGTDTWIAEQLSGVLNSDNRFKVVSPSMLKTIREEISKNQEKIRLNPTIQENLRDSLGIDFLVSVNVSKPS